MSHSFDRIKREFDRFGGQPYIDNTDVTVNQILIKAMRGASIADILNHFSELSVDDVYEALSFAIQDIFDGVSYWRHDSMTPLTQIKGYSEILVGKTEFDELDTIPDAQKHQWLSIIHSSSQRGIARWQQMTQWMSQQYAENTIADREVYQLERFIIDLVSTAQGYEPSLEIDVSPLDPQLNIEVHTDTTRILGSVLAYAKNTFSPQTYIHVEADHRNVAIGLHRQLLYPDDDIQKLISIPYSPVATALTFFHTQNQTFGIRQEEETLIFSTKLPIWHHS